MSGQKKRNALSLEDKLVVIEKKEKEKIGNRALAKEFNCGKTQIDSILAKKEDIRKEYEEFRSSQAYHLSGFGVCCPGGR
jgi:hypothetical protein